MGDHYIPRHYLNGFSIDERLYVYDLKNKMVRRGKSKSEANVNGLWSSDLERHLSEKIEGPAQSAIEKIRLFKGICDSEKHALAVYLLTMWKRVPAARDRTASHIPGLAAAHKIEYFREIDAMLAEGALSSDDAVELKGTISGTLDRLVAGSPDYYWHHTLKDGATPRMMQALRAMDWTFLVTNSDPYITCDDPVFFFREIGVGRSNSELSIPLSSSVTLLAHRSGRYSGKFRDARKGMVVQLNRRTAYNARRFIYSDQLTPWVLKLGLRKTFPNFLILK
ncbi:TPA: DUF4238 domain-containing protein [Stenotrophomonas maltophilia]|nr:DUF4238 domain-containing protein [Stenotrophomonas maltophilia]